MSKSQRTKGAAGERELCAELNKMFGRTDIKRHLGQARDGGDDIVVGDLSIECKRRKSLKGLYDWMRQAVASATPKDYTPVVAVRADEEEWLLVVRLKDLNDFIGRVTWAQGAKAVGSLV